MYARKGVLQILIFTMGAVILSACGDTQFGQPEIYTAEPSVDQPEGGATEPLTDQLEDVTLCESRQESIVGESQVVLQPEKNPGDITPPSGRIHM